MCYNTHVINKRSLSEPWPAGNEISTPAQRAGFMHSNARDALLKRRFVIISQEEARTIALNIYMDIANYIEENHDRYEAFLKERETDAKKQ